MNAFIEAVPVVRDAEGSWWHPGMPLFDEGQTAEWNAWIAAQGLVLSQSMLEHEDSDHPAYVSYYDKEEGFASWHDEQPAGEGWFTLVICDTEDGPCWCWARRKTGGAA